MDDVVDHLGSRDRLQYIHQILENGTGADRQLNAYQKSEDLISVVDYIRTQFLSGIAEKKF